MKAWTDDESFKSSGSGSESPYRGKDQEENVVAESRERNGMVLGSLYQK